MNRCEEGKNAYDLAKRLYPVYRSITGDGVRESFQIIRDYIGDDLKLYEVRSGTQAFDWTVPKEWRIRDSYIESESGERFAQFSENNLHVLGYSVPVDQWMEREELEEYIYTQEDQKAAIPYITSYYKERFGFCMSEEEKRKLSPGRYRAYIDSELFDGALSYADCLLTGQKKEEIVFTTYSCHPQMANDNCSGMVLLAELIKYVKSLPNRYYTYRFAFFPETIGAIVYLSQEDRLDYMRKNTIGGYTLSCVGDDGDYSIIYSKDGNALSDRALINVLNFSENTEGIYKEYSYLDRGSDERQFNSPGVDISVSGYCRTKYWEFPEYHTSLDTMDFISPDGLQGSFDVMKEVIDLLEYNRKYRMTMPCEPQLGKRGLYPSISQKGKYDEVKAMMDFIGYADGKLDLIEISNKIVQPVRVLKPIIDKLLAEQIISVED
ncbi:MAG: DUF4910 domain-containing protein [Eubacterium sp.]|nr:DUF4910 domain-containing protein [Eubacterium sp.]